MLVNLKKVENYEVDNWLKTRIRELSPYQKEMMYNDDIVRSAPFYFMERRKKVNSVFLRFSIVFMFPVLLALIVGLPFNFFVTGSWGYDHEKIKWYSKWVSACGL